MAWAPRGVQVQRVERADEGGAAGDLAGGGLPEPRAPGHQHLAPHHHAAARLMSQG